MHHSFADALSKSPTTASGPGCDTALRFRKTCGLRPLRKCADPRRQVRLGPLGMVMAFAVEKCSGLARQRDNRLTYHVDVASAQPADPSGLREDLSLIIGRCIAASARHTGLACHASLKDGRLDLHVRYLPAKVFYAGAMESDKIDEYWAWHCMMRTDVADQTTVGMDRRLYR